MSLHNHSLIEVEKFFSGFPISSPFSNRTIRDRHLETHKHTLALLIWNFALSARQRTRLKASDPLLYFQEAVSDLVQSQTLMMLGTYKAGRGSLRAAAENFFRFVSLSQGQKISSAKNTYELILITRQITKLKNPEIYDYLNEIVALYSDLCKHVHSSTIAHMALLSAIEQCMTFRANSFESMSAQTKRFCMNASRITFWLRSPSLSNAGHRNRDFVLDSLPRQLKKRHTDRSGI